MHGYRHLDQRCHDSAYETIYDNQGRISVILAAAFVLTVVLGILFGRWFIRPLLEIMDVTRRPSGGAPPQPHARQRKDELGDLASSDKFGRRQARRGDQSDPRP